MLKKIKPTLDHIFRPVKEILAEKGLYRKERQKLEQGWAYWFNGLDLTAFTKEEIEISLDAKIKAKEASLEKKVLTAEEHREERNNYWEDERRTSYTPKELKSADIEKIEKVITEFNKEFGSKKNVEQLISYSLFQNKTQKEVKKMCEKALKNNTIYKLI